MKCTLMPYKSRSILTIQEAKQNAGWQVANFDLPNAWTYSEGNDVKIAVIDSGCDLEHPDLIENLLPGINLINKRKPPADDCGHGTAVAGIICASNNNIGIVGCAPKSKIIPVKVLDSDGNGTLECVSKGVRWATDNGADLLCMSLGAPTKLQNIRKAIQYAQSKNVVTFVAAGNAGDKNQIYYPANYPECISIGSVDRNSQIAKFSNLSDNLDFLAPGVEILSTSPNNWYSVVNGTSFSAPWVCSIAALLLSYVRKTNTDIQLKTADDYRRLLKRYCINKNGKNTFSGFGLMNPNEFIQSFK